MSLTFEAYARYYDMLYAAKDYAAEVEFVLGIARPLITSVAASGRLDVLELGCGTGRHAEILAAAGCNVHGIDRSVSMIAGARERLKGIHNARVEVGDAIRLALSSRFDLVVALFDVLSYQTDDESVQAFLRTAVTHLKPGGVTVFDFWHGPGVLHDPPATRVRRISGDSLSVVRIAEPSVDSATDTVEVSYTLFHNNLESDVWGVEHELHKLRYFFLPELAEFQKQAGLSPAGFFPWMDQQRAPDQGDWHAVLVGRRESA